MLAEFAAHLRHLTLNKAGVMCQHFTGWRQQHAAASALKQLDPAAGFHVTQTLAGRGQREPDVRCALSNVGRVHDGQEQAKVCQIETHGWEGIR